MRNRFINEVKSSSDIIAYNLHPFIHNKHRHLRNDNELSSGNVFFERTERDEDKLLDPSPDTWGLDSRPVEQQFFDENEMLKVCRETF